jgi:tetratricopeptide (TPR) repeat protein
MLGFISYFGFFAYFYQAKTKPIFGRSDAAQQHQGNPVAALWETIKRTKSIQFAIAMGVLGFFIVLFAPNFTSSDSEELQPMDQQTVNIDSLVDLGNEKYNRGEYESALNHYDEVLRVDPTNQFGLYNKALVFYSKKDYRMSISLVNYCIQQNPDYGPAYYLLGDDFKFIDKADSALYFFEKAYELGVRDPGLLQNLGDIYYDQNENKTAIQFYKQALGQDTTLIFVYERLAELEPSQAENYRRRAALVKK